MEMKGVPINEEIYDYIIRTFIPEDNLLVELLSDAEKEGLPMIQLAPEQAKLLYMVVKMAKAKKILEVGTLGGYSAIHLARALPEDGKLTTIDINEHHTNFAKRYIAKAGLENKVDALTANGLEYMEKAAEKGEKFDIIFMDADKPNYPKYLPFIKRLSNEGTIVVFDNTMAHGDIIKADRDEALEGLHAANDFLVKEADALLIPIGDGFTVGVMR